MIRRDLCEKKSLTVEAIVLTAFVLAGNTLLRPLVNALNRAPITEGTTEAIYEVRLTTDAEHLNEARELLTTQLETANYPLREIEVVEHEPDTVEVVATLVGTSANRDELERVVSALSRAAITQHATWAVRTVE